jgi:diacylglycerol kinase (ATP)
VLTYCGRWSIIHTPRRGHMQRTTTKSASQSELHQSVPPKTKGVERLIAATKYSKQGILSALRSEEAFRLECLAALVLAPIAIWLGESGVERALLVLVLFFVLIVELLNSAIESVVDRIGLDYNKLSGDAKDMGSAAVLFSISLAIITWLLLLM